ncbi:MAG: NAD(P)-dependent oxidoreductase [Alphaproteobacteria bacterium]|nr:NAD(P)-dependent oxidoreductase [Alphaproteobacteria bacterium]MCB9931458.1 NAD(P)-dependent oxidoreductase [Alphaproteobacteria bacterium]
MSDQPIGFIGLGAMGRPMAINLANAGQALVVRDVNPTATDILAQRGAAVAESVKAAADRAATVLACMPSVAIAEEVVEQAAEGSAIKHFVNLGTTGSRFSQAAASLMAEKGIAYLDAPISGGPPGAEAATLSIMCSGDKAAYDAARPALEVMSAKLTYLGEKVGAAQTMKLVNNIMSFCNLVAASEAFTLGAKAGLDPEQMLEVVNVSSGRNSASMDKIPKAILTRSFDYGGANYIILKDLELWRQEAEAYGIPAYMGNLVRTLFRQMVQEEGQDKDFTRIFRLMERMADVEMQKTR